MGQQPGSHRMTVKYYDIVSYKNEEAGEHGGY